MNGIELEYGDLVQIPDHPEKPTATVLCGDPILRSEAEELVEKGEVEPSDFHENTVVDDVDNEPPDSPITIQNGNEKYIISQHRVLLVDRREERKTDVPALSENLRLTGNV